MGGGPAGTTFAQLLRREGRTAHDVVVIPRTAVRGENQVLVVSEDDRLYLRDVEVLRSTSEDVLVTAGLASGERICLSPLAAVTDGMRVRPLDG